MADLNPHDHLDFKGLRTWVLSDGKAGHVAQSMGVAQALDVTPEIIALSQQSGRRLLGWLGAEFHVKSLPTAPYPDILIATGRLTAPVVRYIKERSPETFTIQLMNPGGPLFYYDVLAVPSHDRLKPRDSLCTTIGAPNHITPNLLTELQAQAPIELTATTAPRLAVLVGGNSKRYQLTPAKARQLAADILALADQLQATLLVTTSRRTPEAVAKILADALAGTKHFFWQPGAPGENPYNSMLALADAFVVTVDSVSMVSEACSTGRPVYVYDLVAAEKMSKLKHFYQALQESGNIVTDAAQLLTAHPQPLADAARVAGFARAKLLQHRQRLAD